MSATGQFRKRLIEVWQKKHHSLMSNIHEDEIFFPVYDQSNMICAYNFHKIDGTMIQPCYDHDPER